MVATPVFTHSRHQSDRLWVHQPLLFSSNQGPSSDFLSEVLLLSTSSKPPTTDIVALLSLAASEGTTTTTPPSSDIIIVSAASASALELIRIVY